MIRRLTTVLITAVLAAALAGCLNYSKPVAPPQELTPAQENFQAVWAGTKQVLGEYGFGLNRTDRRAGIISTRPLLGRHYTEFWRKGVVSATDLAESTIQTIYRTATVNIRPTADQPERYEAVVTIEVSRSNLPTAQVSSTSEAYSLFTMAGGRSAWLTDFGRTQEEASSATGAGQTDKESTTRRGSPKPADNPWLVELGRDKAMESRIAAEISTAAGKRLGGKG